MISKHEISWALFSAKVVAHIRGYVLPQYGDADQDQMKDWSAQECINTAKKYLARFGQASRPGEEERDLLKAAHCISKALEKINAR